MPDEPKTKEVEAFSESHRVYKGMTDQQYKDVCEEIFKKQDTQNYGELDINQFKEFTIECALSAGINSK